MKLYAFLRFEFRSEYLEYLKDHVSCFLHSQSIDSVVYEQCVKGKWSLRLRNTISTKKYQCNSDLNLQVIL